MDEDILKQWLSQLVDRIGMKRILGPYAFYVEKEGNRGITGFVGIETSHIAVHVWDEQSPALVQFDLYTCSFLPLNTVLEILEQDWQLQDGYRYMLLEREQGFTIKALK
jgi:S-adenosylmethionine/arginine decarboxylase-like enzyme